MLKVSLIAVISLGLVILSGCRSDATDEAGGASLAAPFIGAWQVAKPSGKGVIFNAPLGDCADPVVINRGSDTSDIQTLIYKSLKAEPSIMELIDLESRTTWIPKPLGATTFIAEVKNKDKFWLYTATMGKADWDNPLEYIRCDKT